MKLIDYENQNVKIVDIDGNVFEGIVSDYVYPDDDEAESIIIECKKGALSGKSVEFWEQDIKTIQVIGE